MPIRDETYSDYRRVHDVVCSIKNGNKHEFTLLVKMLTPFLQTYTKLFYGEYNGTSNSVLLLIKYFDKRTRPKDIKKASLKDNRYIKRTKGFRSLMASISTMTYDDYVQELMMALYKLIRRYRVTEHPSFIPFMSRFFHFVLLESLKRTFRNMAINNNLSCVDNYKDYERYSLEMRTFDESLEFLNYNISHDTLLARRDVDCYSDCSFDSAWVAGREQSRLLCLTPGLRELVLRHYIYKHTYQEIAKSYGVSQVTIARIFIRIRSDLSAKGIR